MRWFSKHALEDLRAQDVIVMGELWAKSPLAESAATTAWALPAGCAPWFLSTAPTWELGRVRVGSAASTQQGSYKHDKSSIYLFFFSVLPAIAVQIRPAGKIKDP